MKITFITPAIGKRKGKKYIKSWRIMEPLTIATLKSLTPQDVETEFYDDRIELINYDTKTDLVAITVETYTAYRAYSIAAEFKKRAVPVVMGGYHATIMPDEVARHADAVIVGNAESIWQTVLHDAKNKTLQQRYFGEQAYTGSLPDRSIFKGKKYSPMGLVETGRGCVYQCDFCAITKFYKKQYHPRPVEMVVEDIKRSGKKFFFLIDDNIVANPQYTIELCKALTPLKIKWTSQGALTMANNPELLKWLKKSGCDIMLIGFESLEPENLKSINKDWSIRQGEQNKLIDTIHAAGISIYATFLFGLDHDTPEAFENAVRFSSQHGFYFAAFNHVTPFPETPLYRKLFAENRMVKEKWWLDPTYTYGALPFQPKEMSFEKVGEECAKARRQFFSYHSILKRWWKLLKRNRNPLLSFIFLNSNIMLQKEVDQRMELPIGINLDELPK